MRPGAARSLLRAARVAGGAAARPMEFEQRERATPLAMGVTARAYRPRDSRTG